MPLLPAKAELIDHLLGGKLEDFLRQWRAEGRSWDDIAYEVRSRSGRPVTRASVANWAARLGITENGKKAG